MSLNVPQLKPDVFIPLIVLLSYPPAAATASAADNEVRYLQHASAKDSSFNLQSDEFSYAALIWYG